MSAGERILEAIEQMGAAEAQRLGGWQPIASAPDLERVWVCGWQKRHGQTRGYWWYYEDVTFEGKAFDHPEALYWCPIVLPAFPTPPVEG